MSLDFLPTLVARYQQIVEKIPANVCLIAVSKKQPIEAIEALYRLGHRDFGENYAQEFSEKATVLKTKGCTDIRWHFIGHLQINKVKTVASLASVLHTVDSQKIALEIAKRRQGLGISEKMSVFVEVNIDSEPTKAGILPQEVPHFVQSLHKIEGIQIQGLMCIPKRGQDPRSSFGRLRELELQCRPFTLGHLSMGMSNDYETAIQEGATHIRVGTALFGERGSKS